MKVSIDRDLLVYKKSLYQMYFREDEQQISTDNVFSKDDLAELQRSNRIHLETLQSVRETLGRYKIAFKEMYRARHVDPSDYDFVISVGGDGTFLEAARRLTTQPILGVNSDPQSSVGHFCPCSKDSFESSLEGITGGTMKVKRLNRLSVTVNDDILKFQILNDLLISHQHPGAMSRYRLQIESTAEEQEGSGIWISTAAGSSGGIAAARGSVMALGSKKIQYRPRELFNKAQRPWKLSGGVLAGDTTIRIQSLMREGMIYIDGAHMRLRFSYGSSLLAKRSDYPLQMVVG